MPYTTNQLVSILEDVDKTSFSNERDRVAVKEALFAALTRVQVPWDIVQGLGWQRHVTNVAIKTLINCGFWSKWVESGGQPASTSELANLVDIDPILLKRFLRQLAGQHLVQECEDGDTYALTDFTRALAGPNFPFIWTMMYEMHQPCYANFPRFVAETGYKNPTDPALTNFAHWYGRGKTVFDLCAERPHVGQAFNHMLAAYTHAKTPWVDIYPTASIIDSGTAKPGRALVVDIGGGIGHDTEKMRAKHPSVPAGSLILQDLPNVLEKATIQSPPVVSQASDIFAPQPVQGARVYFLHTVLHNWPDEKAVQVLKNIAVAMERGYSSILVYEVVVASKKPDPTATMSDLAMMLAYSSSERDEDTWGRIAVEAGLKVTKIWSVPESVESIIELELA